MTRGIFAELFESLAWRGFVEHVRLEIKRRQNELLTSEPHPALDVNRSYAEMVGAKHGMLGLKWVIEDLPKRLTEMELAAEASEHEENIDEEARDFQAGAYGEPRD